MPELLLELMSEEIPARMQQRASEDLRSLVSAGLKKQGLDFAQAMAFATPRRLTLVLEDVTVRSPDLSEERRGPRVGAPDKAIAGFLRAAGLSTIDDAKVVSDAKKGDYYLAVINKPGRLAAEIIADVIPEVIGKFPWPKSMRWGRGRLQWVRPLQSIVCLLGGKVVGFSVDGIESGNKTRGHRFMSGKSFAVRSFSDYATKLKERKVLLDASERAAWIAEQAADLAAKHKLSVIDDPGLLAENAGLTEWPQVLIGTFDKEFLQVPGEVLTTAMRAHQKCFSLKAPRAKKLANRFLMVANLEAADGGQAIAAGNERVIRARLADAKFFWEQDLKRKLEPMHFELKGVTFHEKLGSQWQRMERITELAREIAGAVDAPSDKAGRAAQLCKSDLVSGMVGEFPELQGLMGRYYAEAEHMDPEIADAIEGHYKPRGAADTVPTAPVSISVALADKLDTLAGFWSIGETPTGSGDPYQLRRAALGVIRIILENDLRLPLVARLSHAMSAYADIPNGQDHSSATSKQGETFNGDVVDARVLNLLAFFADRLKVHLREKGARHDLIDAVFSVDGQDDVALIVRRVSALADFLETEDGATLLAGGKRAENILRIEEKKDKKKYDSNPDKKLFTTKEEGELLAAIEKSKIDISSAINVENFSGAMRALSDLRIPVDLFFENVVVNSDETDIRRNRLCLLSQMRSAMEMVAKFSKIVV